MPQQRTRVHLYGIMARRARICILFRRGPSRWCQMIRWHTDNDTFECGQWVKHKIHENLSDVSPDGQLLVYGAHDGRASKKYEKWVAVSKPPYFTALALWPVSGPGAGGGAFEDDRTLVLYGWLGSMKKHYKMPLDVSSNKTLVPVTAPINDKPGWFSTVEFVSLYRNKWRFSAAGQWWERSSRSNTWQLCWKRSIRLNRPAEWGAGILSDAYAVRWGEARWPLIGADWAEIDQRGRLVFARQGQMLAGKVTREGVAESLLADFTDSKPDPRPAPAAASRWPR